MQLPSAFNTPELYKGTDIPSILAEELRKKEDKNLSIGADKERILTGFSLGETVKISQAQHLRRSPFETVAKAESEYDLFPEVSNQSYIQVRSSPASACSPDLDIVEF